MLIVDEELAAKEALAFKVAIKLCFPPAGQVTLQVAVPSAFNAIVPSTAPLS
jgi:hypothetical protein